MERHGLNRWLKPNPDEHFDQIQARVHRYHLKRILKIAKATSTSRSKVVRAIISEYFETVDAAKNGRKKQAA